MFEELLNEAESASEPAEYFYYGLVDAEHNSYGFIEPEDPRVTSDMIQVTKEQWQNLLEEQSQGKEIVYYGGQLFTAEQNRYYVDDNGIWQKKTDEEFEQEKTEKEAERIAMLNLTAADVERAIYKAKGIDFEDMITMLESTSQISDSSIDVKALKIELKANNFYRGNPYIDAVGTILGFSKQQLDEFFETNDYTKLL